MPPRYAYWTILIDEQPTAFRAREREELQPTLVQLQRKNANVTMRWFARGKLWESREAEQADFQLQKRAALEPRDRRAERAAGVERRGGDWRPGGTHKDPRDRFKKKNRPERAWSEKDPATQRDRDKPGYVAKKPWEGKPRGDRPPAAHRPAPSGPGEKKPWMNKPRGEGKPPWADKPREPRRSSPNSRSSEGGNDRPWQTKPTGPRAQRKPWVPKPSGDRPWSKPTGDRPPDRGGAFDNRKREGGWNKSAAGAPRGDRPWRDKPAGGPPRGDRPPAHRSGFDDRKREGGWSGKPPGAGDRKPWQSKPAGDRKPWQGKPAGDRKPWQGKPAGGPPAGGPPRGDRPPNAGGKRPWTGKPAPRGGFEDRNRAGGFKPRAPRTDSRPPKRRDDDPDRE